MFLPLADMEILGLKDGDLVHITCPSRRKDTLALLFLSESNAEPQAILMNHICRKNLAAQVGDIVNIQIFDKAVNFSKIVLRKIGGFAPYATPENHEQNSLTEYFSNGYRPVCKNDLFEIKNQLGTMEFMITWSEPSSYGFVTPDTMIAIDW